MSTSISSEVESPSDNLPPPPARVYLISLLLITIGIGAIAFLIYSIVQDADIRLALEWEATPESPTQPSLILVFLEQFGIIIPMLFLFLGGFLISIGLRLRNGSIQVAHWAGIALLWMTIGLVSAGLLEIFNIMRQASDDGTTIDVAFLLDLLGSLSPLIVGTLVLGGVWAWMNANITLVFFDDDLLSARETRLAWNLLIPTLTIIVLVAARPLEQTFIRSLTDKQFAGSAVPQFVGLDNYTQLLGIRIETVNCRIDDDTGECSVRENGSIRWELINRAALEDGYRTVWNIRIPFSSDQSLAISGRDNDFLESIGTTVIFTVISVSAELVIGLFIAVIVNSRFRGRGLMRAVMLVPWAIPTVISARLWELMLKDTSAGIVNKVMMDLSLISSPQAWLSEPSLQLPAAIMVDVWKTAPFMALLLLAGLQTIPKDLYEAASVDGANPVRRFFSITLPLLRPAIAIALVFRTLDALRVFDLFNVLFGRQQLSMATYNYETLVNNQLDGYASAISVIIFILISIFAFIYVRILNVETS